MSSTLQLIFASGALAFMALASVGILSLSLPGPGIPVRQAKFTFFTPRESSSTGFFHTLNKTDTELLAIYDNAVASLNLTLPLSASGTSPTPWSASDYAVMNAFPCVKVAFGLQPNPFDGTEAYDTIDRDTVA